MALKQDHETDFADWSQKSDPLMQAWPAVEENTADEEFALSGKTRGRRRKPKDELSDDVRYIPNGDPKCPP